MTGTDFAEPRIQPPPTGTEARVNASIERAASVMTTVVAALLMVFVAVAIVGVVADAWHPLCEHDFVGAAVAGLDAAFIVVILLELVHTTLSRGPISTQIQEFLVIGITSAIRSGIETTARRGTASPRETAIVIVITSFAALLLVGALSIIRQRLSSERRTQRSTPQGSP
jgi:phosphate starvation-inducible membrane PsiE